MAASRCELHTFPRQGLFEVAPPGMTPKRLASTAACKVAAASLTVLLVKHFIIIYTSLHGRSLFRGHLVNQDNQ